MRLNIYSYMHHHGMRCIRLRNSTATFMRQNSEEWELLPLDDNPIYGLLLLTDNLLNQMGHEDFFIYYEKIENSDLILKGMLAIFSRDLGPAIAGLRVNAYDTEEDMIEDALMISRTVARKASITGLDFGGGQFIIDYDLPQEFSLGNPHIFPLLEHVGWIVNEFSGRVILSPDLNTSVNSMHIVRRSTEHVIGNPSNNCLVPVEEGREEQGVINGSGDSADMAAFSVFQSLKQAFCFLENSHNISLRGRKLLVIGLGKCGMSLVDYLIQEGADIYGADIDPAACHVMEEVYGIKILARDRQQIREVYKFPCDAILPCATGSLISDKRIAGFRTKIICGTASNQLNDDRDAVILQERQILFVPDFIANCGGLLNAVQEVRNTSNGLLYRETYDKNKVKSKIHKMQDGLKDILTYSNKEGLSPWELSLATAHSRLDSQRKKRWIRYFNRKISSDSHKEV